MYMAGYLVGILLIWGICFLVASRMKSNFSDNYYIPLLISTVLYVIAFMNSQGILYLLVAGLSLGSICYLWAK